MVHSKHIISGNATARENRVHILPESALVQSSVASEKKQWRNTTVKQDGYQQKW